MADNKEAYYGRSSFGTVESEVPHSERKIEETHFNISPELKASLLKGPVFKFLKDKAGNNSKYDAAAVVKETGADPKQTAADLNTLAIVDVNIKKVRPPYKSWQYWYEAKLEKKDEEIPLENLPTAAKTQ